MSIKNPFMKVLTTKEGLPRATVSKSTPVVMVFMFLVAKTLLNPSDLDKNALVVEVIIKTQKTRNRVFIIDKASKN